MNPTREESLTALDKSIEKWQSITNGENWNQKIKTIGCPLCSLSFCDSCVLREYTDPHGGVMYGQQCRRTPFYQTSFYQSYTEGKPKRPNQEDNRMLCLLYEVRRDLVVKLIKRRG